MPRPDLPPIDYAALRAQIPMARVLQLLDFRPLRVRGPQLRGPCPLPNCSSARAPDFSVNLQRHIFHCFACGSGGNQLDLWAAAHQLLLAVAAVDLCRAAQLPVPRRITDSATRPSPHSATN